ncbi:MULTISPECIES: hypothetical protein [Pseudomonas putida group]|uniref:hypothetical protein n=1 Tax=Pseudomonas putida group TaxID=136845 RepID=UPI00048C4D5A|nr:MULTISPECIES: hypothetical protein [Pseudomonas putida group]QKL09249.1 hypothetical protein GEV41_23675 [Pseudomonas putida]
MINTSDKIILAPGVDINQEVHSALDLVRAASRKKNQNEGDNAFYSRSGQIRNRFALFIIKDQLDSIAITPKILNEIYELAIAREDQSSRIKELYTSITGLDPVMIEDALGLRVPFRAMLALLWSKGKLTLPYTFTTEGVFAKYRELLSATEGFVQSLATGSTTCMRATRIFQYRTDWFEPEDVKFDELWQATPYISACNNKDKDDFRYLSWLAIFAAKHPKFLSPDQVFYLEKYQQYINAKSALSDSAYEFAMTYEQFKAYFTFTPEEAMAMTPKERERARLPYIKEWKHNNSIIKKNAKDKAIAEKLSKSDELSVEQRAIQTPTKRRSRDNLDWLNNQFYLGREHVNIESLSAHWAAAANYHIAFLNTKNYSTRYLRKKIDALYFLFDYLFCYLPWWFECNPDTVLRFPTRPDEFQRVLYWKTLVTENDLEFDLFGLGHRHPIAGSSLPMTLTDYYELCHSRKTKAKFIKDTHTFFEVISTDHKFIKHHGEQVVDGWFPNPVNQHLDSDGSGARGQTDKVVLPLESTVIAKSYVEVLDVVGLAIQKQILSGQLRGERLQQVKESKWISLSEIGIEQTIRIKNPDDDTDVLSLPVTTVVNAYAWYSGIYGCATTEVMMPWLSLVRMLNIALHAGLRLQNCQWLDVHTFDKLLAPPELRVFDSCILYVNTDKDGQDRPVVVPQSVMDSLIEERKFQLDVFHTPMLPTFYENDAKDPKGYGEIFPLFRSPWSPRGLPFSDRAYSEKWTLILFGIQNFYNSLVPTARQHQFVTYNPDGKMLSVHTPHALRATWITHQRIYGHLHVSIAQRQVAHKNRYSTDYYTTLSIAESTQAIAESNHHVMRSAWSQLNPKPSSGYEPKNSITTGWHVDRQKLSQDQSFISVTSSMIEQVKTGMQIIATDKDPDVGFYSNCVCLRNGSCPEELISFTGKSRVCGLCPIAAFGIDHLPAINCLIRKLAGESENLVIKLKGLKTSKACRAEIEAVHHDLTVTKLELSSYWLINQTLKARLEQEDNSGLITRMRDLKSYQTHEVDMDDPAQLVIAQLLDSQEFPQFSSPNYPYMIEKIAKNQDLLKVSIAQGAERDKYAGQVLSIMKTMNLSIADIAERINSNALNLAGAMQ